MVLHSDLVHQAQGNPFPHSRGYRLRSRRKQSSKEEPRIESFEEASRLLRMFHAHEARSLDSIVEHPEDDDDVNYDSPIFCPLSRKLTKVKTMSCLSDLEESSRKGNVRISGNGDVTISNSSRIKERRSMPISDYSDGSDEGDDEWEF